MTLIPESQIRTRSRTCRVSSCCRHPTELTTGICPTCLCERLSGIDPELSSSLSAIPASLPSLGNRAGDSGIGGRVSSRRSKPAGATSTSRIPDLRRCRSVSASRCEASSSFAEPRRKSCDVRARNTLAILFDIDDEKSGPSAGSKVEPKKFSKLANISNRLKEEVEHGEEIRVSVDALQQKESAAAADDAEEGELKTMKEFIDLEIQSKNQKTRDLIDIAGNFWEAASVFSKKLCKWRQNQRIKKMESRNGEGIDGNKDFLTMRKGKKKWESLRDTQSEIGEYAMGRRSCDTEPRFSVDAGMLSVECPRISIEEPRASWDGYLVARTTPRLAPILSAVDSLMMGNGNRLDTNRLSVDGQMHSIMEDESSSGGSGQSNSDSSSSQRRSSFDRSSSVRSFGVRTLGLEGDEAKSTPNDKVSPANVKLVITERELKDWHLKSVKDDCSEKLESLPKDAATVETWKSLNASKKSTRWRKVCSVLGFKHKINDNDGKNLTTVLKSSVVDASEEHREVPREVKDASSRRLTRSTSVVRARNSCEKIESIPSRRSVSESPGYPNTSREGFVLERSRSTKNTSTNLDNGLLPFYLMPLRSFRSKNSTRNKLLYSHYISGNVLN